MVLHLSVILFTGRCTPPRQTPLLSRHRDRQTPHPETATAEGGTHPNGRKCPIVGKTTSCHLDLIRLKGLLVDTIITV